eukprot:scaffold967_cov321-Pavlova_lutheri.AAC.29
MARVALGYGVTQVSALWMGVYVIVGRLLVGRVRQMGNKRKTERTGSQRTHVEPPHDTEGKRPAGQLGEDLESTAATSSDLLTDACTAGIAEGASSRYTHSTFESNISDAPESPSTVFCHPENAWEDSSQEG